MPGTRSRPASGGELTLLDPHDVTAASAQLALLAGARGGRARPARASRATRGGHYDVSLYRRADRGPPRSDAAADGCVSSNFPSRGSAPRSPPGRHTSAEGLLRELLRRSLIEKAYAALITGGYPSLSAR